MPTQKNNPEKPTQPPLPSNWGLGEESINSMRDKAQEALNEAPPEVQKAVVKSKGFIEDNKKVLATALVVIVALKVNKRKTAKAVAKAVSKELQKADAISSLPSLHDILQELRAVPGMAYIPHGGGMVHILAGKDAIITVFGSFDNMDNTQIWSYVAKALNIKQG